MSFYMQKDGRRALSEMLINTARKIDGMYAEYSALGLVAGARSHEFYANNAESLGYIRLPIAQAFVDDKSQINFMSYFGGEDTINLDDMTQDAYIRCATLASLDKTSPSNDLLLFTVDLMNPIKLVKGAYVVIRASMRLGDA